MLFRIKAEVVLHICPGLAFQKLACLRHFRSSRCLTKGLPTPKPWSTESGEFADTHQELSTGRRLLLYITTPTVLTYQACWTKTVVLSGWI